MYGRTGVVGVASDMARRVAPFGSSPTSGAQEEVFVLPRRATQYPGDRSSSELKKTQSTSWPNPAKFRSGSRMLFLVAAALVGLLMMDVQEWFGGREKRTRGFLSE
jgi:hypothetical protein